MSLYSNCTCDEREHACSPPCPMHPERGGGLGNPGTLGLLTPEAKERLERSLEDAILGPLDLPGGPAPRTVPADPQDAEDERAVRAEFQRRIDAAKRMEEELPPD